MVDPLGDVLMKLLPEGFCALFAPAVLLPALVLTDAPAPGVVPLMPVVVPLDVVPLDVVPVDAAPVDVVPVPPAEVPLCAKAHAFTNASAAANPSVVILIAVSFWTDRRQTGAEAFVPALAEG
jgi:hypothetical protein